LAEPLEKTPVSLQHEPKGRLLGQCGRREFFHTLKSERVHHQNYQDQEEAKKDLFEYIEVFYSRKRRHSTIENLSPFEYEELKQPALR